MQISFAYCEQNNEAIVRQSTPFKAGKIIFLCENYDENNQNYMIFNASK